MALTVVRRAIPQPSHEGSGIALQLSRLVLPWPMELPEHIISYLSHGNLCRIRWLSRVGRCFLSLKGRCRSYWRILGGTDVVPASALPSGKAHPREPAEGRTLSRRNHRRYGRICRAIRLAHRSNRHQSMPKGWELQA